MKIIEDLIPVGRVNRPGVANTCRYITIHETANEKAGANAKSHAKYIKNVKGQTSWHYTVDETGAYRHIPDCEKSYHTSDKEANESSISIEICVNSDGDFARACDNAACLVRELMRLYDIKISNVRQHHDWTGKDCPKRLRRGGWAEFIVKCGEEAAASERAVSVDELRRMGYTHIAL